MGYDEKILMVLKEAGPEGLTVRKIARHVFNASNSFFDTLDFEEVHRYVGRYLLRQSKSPNSSVMRTAVRGHYSINMSSPIVKQFLQRFDEKKEDVKITPVETDNSLSLFDFDD